MRSSILILAMFVTALVGCAAPMGDDLSANESQEATIDDDSVNASEENISTDAQELGGPTICRVIYVCGTNWPPTHTMYKPTCDANCPGSPNGCYKSCYQYL